MKGKRKILLMRSFCIRNGPFLYNQGGNTMNKNSLLTMSALSEKEILSILEDALEFSKKYQDWQFSTPKLVANLFFEPSTRTHYSFASAELQLGCSTIDFNASASSVQKGESLYDTVKTFEAIGYDAVVIRHPQDEYFKELEAINIPILNAGDGCGNHPTQCLLDLYTILEEFGHFDGLKVAIIGDIIHSRVAASNYDALTRLRAEVRFGGLEAWLPKDKPTITIDEACEWADVVMLLRIQHERHGEHMSLSKEEYLAKYGLTKERYAKMKDHAIVMHPAPVNRGVEIDDALVEADKSRIFKQMMNGVLVRKAVLKRAFEATFEGGKA